MRYYLDITYENGSRCIFYGTFIQLDNLVAIMQDLAADKFSYRIAQVGKQ